MTNESTVAPLRVAFIGCGGYGRNLARAGRESRLIEPVCCYDINPAAAASFAANYELRAVAELDAVLSDRSIEAVVIATPNSVHRDCAVAAASAGKHVFVDKPIANEILDALEMIQECRSNNVKLSVGHNGRFHSGHRKIKQMIENGDIGSPLGAEANFSHSGGLTMKPDEWRYNRETCPALPLMQLGVHFVDTIHYFLGFADEVFSYAQRSIIEAENDDSVVNLIKLKNGPLAYVGSYYACPHTYYVVIHGTEGSLYCDNGKQLTVQRMNKKEHETLYVGEKDTQVEELEDFARAVRTDRVPEVDGEAALQALAVVRAAMESQALCKPVKVGDVLDPLSVQKTIVVRGEARTGSTA